MTNSIIIPATPEDFSDFIVTYRPDLDLDRCYAPRCTSHAVFIVEPVDAEHTSEIDFLCVDHTLRFYPNAASLLA